jgi:hypothetical protein
MILNDTVDFKNSKKAHFIFKNVTDYTHSFWVGDRAKHVNPQKKLN